jgi:predicted dienelactone hydrolase
MRQTRRKLATAVVALLAFRAAAAAAGSYKVRPGPRRVETLLLEWRDEARERDVPAKLYLPEGAGAFPVVVFSHGAGGSREGYAYLGRHWAGHGYVSVHLQHHGSDEATWRGRPDPLEAIGESARDLRNALWRPRDVSFALDTLEALNREDARFKGKLDMQRVGVAGHSFGAYTTLAVAGQTFVLPRGRTFSFRDPRVKAAIPMSAPAPRRAETYQRAFGSIRVPCLHMTGTRDDSIVSGTRAEQRRIPFDHISGADQYLVTLIGGDHMVFSGRGRLPGGRRDELFQRHIRSVTTAFWDAYLRDDPAARRWLAGGGCEAALKDVAALEIKLAEGPT